MKKHLKDQLEALKIATEFEPTKDVLMMIVDLLECLAQEITNMQFSS